MKKDLIIGLIVLVVVIILIVVGVYIIGNSDDAISPMPTSCTELGCSEIDIYVGSINSDKYYECDCHYADRILSENIICFSSDEDALDEGYAKSDC